MADIAELKHMIISFRNTELQTLLQFAGRSKVGRKQELLTRALELLKNLNPQVQLKIQELYRVTVGARPPLTANSSAADLARLAASGQQQRDVSNAMSSMASSVPILQAASRNAIVSPSASSTENMVAAALQSALSRSNNHHNNNNNAIYMNGVSSAVAASRVLTAAAAAAASGVNGMTVRQIAASKTQQQQQQQQQSLAGRISQAGRAAAAAAPAPAAVGRVPDAIAPLHPNVTLKRLPFFDKQGVILKPTHLRGQTRFIEEKSVRKQVLEGKFCFRLSPQQATQITMSCDQRPGAKMTFPVQLQMRFCVLDIESSQTDCFPAGIKVNVNGKPAPLPPIIPSNRPQVEGKRPSKPVDITSLCKLSPTGDNEIVVQWTADTGGRHYVIIVDLVKRLNSDVLMKRLISNGTTQSSTTRSMIREKMASEDGDDIAACDLRVSLQCPISKCRITTPCRAATCKHIQIFDAATFLMMNERKPTWICPVCDQDAHFDLLSIDGYFQQVLERAPSNVADISLDVDGTWTPLKANGKKDTSFQHSQSSNSNGAKIGSSSSSAATNGSTTNKTASSSSASSANTASSSSSSAAPKRTVEAVITLDSDSDDDDDEASKPPPAKRPNLAQNGGFESRKVSSGGNGGGSNGNPGGNGIINAATASATSAAPRPVALTANQSVQERRSSPAVAAAATDGNSSPGSAAAAPVPGNSSGMFGMSPYGLPPPPSELMDLRNPANLELLDFLPGNSSSNSSPRNRPSTSTAASSSSTASSQPVFCEADVVLLD